MKLLSALVAVLLVAGCGVRASGTIPGGPAPKVSAAGIALFFVSGGNVSLVMREWTAALASPTDAVSLLAAGPNPTERAAGLTTEVSQKITSVEVDLADSNTVAIRIPIAPGDLSSLAVEQLACTAIANLGPGQSDVYTAVVIGGGQQRSSNCSVFRA
jgi:hypothetical protein